VFDTGMDYSRYLHRIKFSDRAQPDDLTLKSLHEHHVMFVPFENLDIHYRKMFDLEIEHVFRKVVENVRGGFCYELNYLFNSLLNAIGFSSEIISSRIFDSSGALGPEFDHMSIHVRTDKDYLADVGFGDLFIRPLEIKEGVQSDGRNMFLIEAVGDGDYALSMSSGVSDFEKKYVFCIKEVPVENFKKPCLDKQTNPDSYFVKNTICTRATEMGRVTLFNNKIIRKSGEKRIETPILSDMDLRVQLMKHFDIEIK
jgi:N-hydroxyarylamine O-acetyltransferase